MDYTRRIEIARQREKALRNLEQELTNFINKKLQKYDEETRDTHTIKIHQDYPLSTIRIEVANL